MYHEPTIDVLKGKTIVEITGATEGSEVIKFRCSDGSVLKMYHEQGCCENVSVKDVSGDLQTIIGNPILQAEEKSNQEDVDYGSQTYTFYTIGTVRGRIDISWLGESNGYYSEGVDLKLIMITRITIAPGLELSKDRDSIWLHFQGGIIHGAIALDRLEAPLVRDAAVGWAKGMFKQELKDWLLDTHENRGTEDQEK